MSLQMKSILNAFQPAKEITDPKKFAGRRQQIEQGCELLLSHDHIFIYGIPGIGKSSLAWQLNLIAAGDVRLLREIGSPLQHEPMSYLTCYLKCNDSNKNINDLIHQLMTDQQGLAQWDAAFDFPELGAYDREGALNPLLIAEFRRRVDKIVGLGKSRPDGLGDGLAIFIDEFERLADPRGFASLIRMNLPQVLFVTVGVADTVRDLVKDHESIVRQLDTGGMLIPKMREEELRLIVQRAEEEIGGQIRFDEGAINELVRIAQGQPYLLQLVGRKSLVRAFKEGLLAISQATVTTVLTELSSDRAALGLEEKYLKAIGNSPERETVLRAMASSLTEPISTVEIYEVAKREGVSSPNNYLAHLHRSQVVEKKSGSFYRIVDPLLRAYAAATPRRLPAVSAQDGRVAAQPGGRGIYLVHLSDVHFGEAHYFSQLHQARDSNLPEADRPSLERYLIDELLMSRATFPMDVMIVSGDLTQTATTGEFAAASRCFKKIAESVNLPERRLVMIPGNHDVSWSIRQADPAARGMAFGPYLKFRRGLGARLEGQLEPESIFEVHDFTDELGCVILALNSAVLEGPTDHRGYLGQSQLAQALAAVDAACAGKSAIKVAVLHHHLVPVTSIETDLGQADQILRDVGDAKRQLLEHRFSLVLHGHRHHAHEELIGDSQHKMVVVGCGSTGVVQAERGSQPLQFNRVRLLTGDSLRIEVQRMSFDVERRKWVPDPQHLRIFSLSP